MAFEKLYPPSVEAWMPAFVVPANNSNNNVSCPIYFTISQFTNYDSSYSIHVSIIKQSTGQSVVDKNIVKSKTGIILDLPATPYNNYYVVSIPNSKIKGGWQAGWIYKVQIRLSKQKYGDSNPLSESTWLATNAADFSEWSTYCTVKAIPQPVISFPAFTFYAGDILTSYNSNDLSYSRDTVHSFHISTFDLDGSYYCSDPSESLYSYNVKLLNEDEEVIEDSGTIYTNEYKDSTKIHYAFKTELQNKENYRLGFEYKTINNYTEKLPNLKFINNYENEDITQVFVYTVDDNVSFIPSSVQDEQEKGRIGTKFYINSEKVFNGNLCLRRTDSKSNFRDWVDIKIVPCVNTNINNLDMVYDYTVESGVWYKYGVQLINTSSKGENRTVLRQQPNPIIREFEYSYLLGEDGRQLKLIYNTNLSSYAYTVNDTKTDTIGGQYPFIARSGNTKYRTFPISGLISFSMDETNESDRLFTNDVDIYQSLTVAQLYQDRRRREYLGQYDYKREFDFREKVLAFLQDGKPKLFKSATEGNIIIRLTNVTTQPQQSLNRMIYSFSATAYEIAEATMENYAKYGFYEVGEPVEDFDVTEMGLGQLDADVKPGDDLIKLIWAKYENNNKKLSSIHNVKIEFSNPTHKVAKLADNSWIMGNYFEYNRKTIIVRGDHTRIYEFDDVIPLTSSHTLKMLGNPDPSDPENSEDVELISGSCHVLVDFLYEATIEYKQEEEIDRKEYTDGVGQIMDTLSPNTNIYSQIYFKYYRKSTTAVQQISQLYTVCIEADPGAVFAIRDSYDTYGEQHDINWTGVLNIENIANVTSIQYLGMRQKDGTIASKKTDAIIDYTYSKVIKYYNTTTTTSGS